jgi:DeoR family transcriptional regulator, aga operon transcriptional repressor
MQINLSLSNLERQEQIQLFIRSRQRATVAEIADTFAISQATVRRDLDLLAEAGEVERFHGGARAVDKAPPEQPAILRQGVETGTKAAIGQLAASVVSDGETLFIGSGTTALAAAQALRRRNGLTVFTNSVLVINALGDHPGITLISLGGILRRTELSLIGHLTEDALKEIHVDRVLMGIHAVDLQRGLTSDYLPETMTDRAILKAGREVMILADHTKCGRVSTAFVAPVTAMQTFVTDHLAPPPFVQALEEQGIRVLQVAG